MKDLTADEYLASPLTQQEIDQYRDSQKRWIKFEKICSIAFLSVVNMPLFLLAMTTTWKDILIGAGFVALFYLVFKGALLSTLDKKFPCRVVIDGFPFVSPQDVKSLQEDSLDEGIAVPSEFLNRIKALNRPIMNFEKSFLESLSKT